MVACDYSSKANYYSTSTSTYPTYTCGTTTITYTATRTTTGENWRVFSKEYIVSKMQRFKDRTLHYLSAYDYRQINGLLLRKQSVAGVDHSKPRILPKNRRHMNSGVKYRMCDTRVI